MLDVNHILLVVEQQHIAEPAIHRAIWLAEKLNADITILTNAYDVYGDDSSTLDQVTRDNLYSAVIEQKQIWLEELCRQTETSATIIPNVLWHKHIHESVLDIMDRKNFDLVIKNTKKHSLIDRIFTHTDWNILRHCPAPVLLVKEDAPWRNNRLLAAIDATSPDEGHQLINDNILSFAEHIADHLQTDLHIGNAYSSVAIAFAMTPEVTAPDDIQEHVTRQHAEATLRWAQKYNIENDHVHVGEGETEQVMTNFAKELDVDVVVVGSVGRVGLSSFLIGNTAERLVDQLPCDILIIKPKDGVDPTVS